MRKRISIGLTAFVVFGALIAPSLKASDRPLDWAEITQHEQGICHCMNNPEQLEQLAAVAGFYANSLLTIRDEHEEHVERLEPYKGFETCLYSTSCIKDTLGVLNSQTELFLPHIWLVIEQERHSLMANTQLTKESFANGPALKTFDSLTDLAAWQIEVHPALLTHFSNMIAYFNETYTLGMPDQAAQEYLTFFERHDRIRGLCSTMQKVENKLKEFAK